MKNALTFDLEEYYHVLAFADRVSVSDWDAYPSRVQGTVDRLMPLLDEANTRATFFVLGWLARKYPHLIRRIAAAGHEIGCHSNLHRQVFTLAPPEFYEDTRQAKEEIEQIVGSRIHGYRAPSFSIVEKSWWALEILRELGFTYDSSVFPVDHPSYGVPNAPRSAFVVQTKSGAIVEFPMPTLEMFGRRSPIAGGAYLRLLPYSWTRAGISYINGQENRPVCVYVHPWELDCAQPRVAGARLSSVLRHYIGLRGVESKLRRLLQDFEFGPLGSLVAEVPILACAVAAS